ncbi:putative Tigger transposable element-derived protein 1-like 265, partial [Homarus americanus]
MAGFATLLMATKVTRFRDAEMASMERMLSKKAIKNISDSWEAITQHKMNSVWLSCGPSKAGFDEVDDADVEDLLDSHNGLTNEDLIELERLQQEEMTIATVEDADESPTQLLTVRNLRKLISSFEMAMDMALEMDPNVE